MKSPSSRAIRNPTKDFFESLVSCVFGLLTMQLTSDANYFVNAKSHAREKQLLTGCLYTVVVYQFSEHKAQLYSTCILCIHPLIIGFYHGSGKSLIIMMCLLNVYKSIAKCKCDCSLSQEKLREYKKP